MRQLILTIAFALLPALAPAQNLLTLDLTDQQLKGLSYAAEQANAACKALDVGAPCNETPEEYAQRLFAGVAQDYYNQLTKGFQAALDAEIKKARETNDETKLDAIAQAAGVERPEKKPPKVGDVGDVKPRAVAKPKP